MEFIEDKLKNKQKRLNKHKVINNESIESIHNSKISYFQNLHNIILPKKMKLLEKYKKNNDMYQIKVTQEEINKITNKEEELYYFFNCTYILDQYFTNNTLTDELLYTYYKYNNINNTFMINYTNKSFRKHNICKYCNTDLELSKNNIELSCYTCGLTEYVLDNTCDTRSFNEQKDNPMYYKKKFIYERKQYFKECFYKIQGKVNIDIDNDTLDNIKSQLEIEKIHYTKLNISNIKKILKLKKLSKYNEYIPYIIKLLTGSYPLNIDIENEKKLFFMFNVVNVIYEKYKPINYSSTLPINYCFYKLSQILKKHEYLLFFPLLKDKKLIKERDLVWKKIIDHINYNGIDYEQFPEYKDFLDIDWYYYETI